MNPEIKALIERLQTEAGKLMVTPEECADEELFDALTEAAVTLQAVFDPENQPSQFGTELTS